MGQSLTKPSHLIAFDLDGTVFQDGRPMRPRVRSALEAAHQKGCLLAVSTGRGRAMLPPELLAQPWLDYASTSNGARVLLPRTGETLLARPMPAALVLSLIEAYPGASWQVFLEDMPLFERRSLSAGRLLRRGNLSLRELRHFLSSFKLVPNVGSRLKKLGLPPVEKCSAIFPTEALCAQALAELTARGNVEAATTTGFDIEITAAGVSKGSALTALGALLGLPKARILSFGDSGNDLSMAQASFFVAMGNASPEVRAAAHAVTAPVEEDGVALYLEDWLQTL